MPPNRGAKNNNDSTNALAELEQEIESGPPGSGYTTADQVADALAADESALDTLSAALPAPSVEPEDVVTAGFVRTLDLGVVSATDLLAGRVTLYETGADETVINLRYGDTIVFADHGSVNFEIGPAQIGVTGGAAPRPLAGFGDDSSHTYDAHGITTGSYNYGTINDGADVFAGVPAHSGSLTATVAPIDDPTNANSRVLETPGWESGQEYMSDVCIIEAGHFWTNDEGTSGGVKPDFAGNVGSTVMDNGITWTDAGAVPTTGSTRVYIDVVKAVAYP